MKGLSGHWNRLVNADDGVTTTEYALALAIVVLAAVGAGLLLGIGARNLFEIAHTTLRAAVPAES